MTENVTMSASTSTSIVGQCPESPDTDRCSCASGSTTTTHIREGAVKLAYLPPQPQAQQFSPEQDKREFYESHRKRRLDTHPDDHRILPSGGVEVGGVEPQKGKLEGNETAKAMLPTPSTSHVNYEHVYEPAEDSFLLLDTISSVSESSFLRSRFSHATPSPLVLEIGTGSGVVLAFVAAQTEHIFGRSDVLTLGCDVNPYACRAAAETVRLAISEAPPEASSADFAGIINADLTSSLRPGSVDVLIFNPPYVPTEVLPDGTNNDEFADRDDFKSSEEFERNSYLLALSYAGGQDGMEITNRLLTQLPQCLSQRGVAYILLCAQNRPEDVKMMVRSWPGAWAAETVASSGKKAGWEKLSILRIWRP
jgi:release factor glutamine methyltransferase